MFSKNQTNYNLLLVQLNELFPMIEKIKIEDYPFMLAGKVREDQDAYRDKCISIVHLLNQLNQNWEEGPLTDEFALNKST